MKPILVVDESPRVRTGLSDMLQSKGYEVVSCPDFTSALDQIIYFERRDSGIGAVIGSLSLPGPRNIAHLVRMMRGKAKTGRKELDKKRFAERYQDTLTILLHSEQEPPKIIDIDGDEKTLFMQKKMMVQVEKKGKMVYFGNNLPPVDEQVLFDTLKKYIPPTIKTFY